jgi:Na+/melibiose symporter-like transporter
METRAAKPNSILWAQVFGLAAIQGSIALTWVIYNLYLPNLLVDMGLAAGLARVLLIIENLLGAVMEPLMGSFSDQTQRWLGSRFPFVSVGVILSAACFIAIPTVAFLGTDAADWMGSLLIVLLVAWALCMTIFRSPALSLLGRYAFSSGLPQAASILTLVGGVAGAMGPLASGFILDLGPWVAFGVGSAVLLLAALALRLSNPGQTVHDKDSDAGEAAPFAWWGLIWVFGAGVGVGLGFRMLMTAFPQVLAVQVPQANVGWVLGSIFLSLALTAVPMGSLASRWGNQRAMAIGLGLMGGLLTLTVLSSSTLLAVILAFSLVSNGSIPFALSMVPAARAGLGTGIYFSGGAVASSLFGLLFAQATFEPTVLALIGVVAFLGAGFCVMCSRPVN